MKTYIKTRRLKLPHVLKQKNYFYKYINTDLTEIKYFYILASTHCINNCYKTFYSFVFIYY